MENFLTVSTVVEWNPLELLQKVEAARIKSLKRGGGLTRAIMRNSMRRSKSSSAPGKPPAVHSRGPSIKSLIGYDYDPSTGTVVIGPAFRPSADPNFAPLPSILEHGGPSRLRLTGRRAAIAKRSTVVVTVQPRPFAAPALEKFSRSYPDLFADSIR